MPDPPATAEKPRKRLTWKRRLLWALALLLALVVATTIWIKTLLDHPEPVLSYVASQFGQDLFIDNLDFNPSGQLTVRDLRLRESGKKQDYAQIDYLELHWNYGRLSDRVIDELRVHGIRLWLNRIPRGKGDGDLIPFTLKRLILGQATLMLEDLGEGIPPIPVKVGEVDPMVFNDLRLGGKSSDPAAQELQTARAFNIAINSPLNPLAPVLFFEEIEFQFTWAGIQEKLIDKLSFRRPVIYVGEELFDFVKMIRDNNLPTTPSTTAPAAREEPWTLANFDLRGGKIDVTTFGRPGFTLPLSFAASAHGLVLDDFTELALDIQCEIPETNLSYPEYQVTVVGMKGDLEFSLPPGKDANNVVQTVFFDSLAWRDIELTEAFVSITFDVRGLFADFGGKRGDGYVGGDLSVFSNRGFEWVASAYASKVEAEPLSLRLSPENIVLDGQVDGSFVVSGKQRQVQRFYGDIELPGPGVLTITAVDELIDRLPDHWDALKTELTQISLRAFERYDYTSGTCEFNYAPPKSFVQLKMDGQQGKRNFNVRWLDLRENPTWSW